MRMPRPAVLAATIATTLLAACTPQPEKLDKIEGLSFPNRRVLERHTAVSEGTPVTLGPYQASDELSAHAACLGDGKISLKVYPARFTPNVFTNKHGGIIAYLTNGCTGRHWGTYLGTQSTPKTYCVVVTFEGHVTDYEVIIADSGEAGASAAAPTADPTPTAAVNPCHTAS